MKPLANLTAPIQAMRLMSKKISIVNIIHRINPNSLRNNIIFERQKRI